MCCKPFPVLHSHMLWQQWVIGSCWCMGDSRCTASPLHIQAEQTQIQWKQPLLVCCFHDVYNIMARRICVNRFWLAGGKTIILIGSPFYTCIVGVNPQPWMPINTQTKECIASTRSAWVAPIPPNTPLKFWTEILQKSVQSWYIPFALQVCYDIRVSKIVHVFITHWYCLMSAIVFMYGVEHMTRI